MNETPPLGGLGGSIHQTANRIREVIDLDKASAEEMRRYTLAGIVDLSIRMAQIEEILRRQEQANKSTQVLVLAIGGLAWIALVAAAFAIARVI